MIRKIITLVLLAIAVQNGQSARILAVFPVASISHQVIFQPIWKELSLRGHDVTVLTPSPLSDPKLTNLTEIDFNYLYDLTSQADIPKKMAKDNPLWKRLLGLHEVIFSYIMEMIDNVQVKKILDNPSEKFDLVLVESHNPLVYAFSARFKCPTIGVSSLGGLLHVHDSVGNPTHPILAPDIFLNVDGELTLWETLNSILYNVWYRLMYKFVILPRANQLARSRFGEDFPDLGEVERNVSLQIFNTNPILHTIRPNVPTVIEMQQMHITAKKPLPKDLQTFLDNSPEGVVYFSLGSNVKSANLSEEVRSKIIDGLAALPYKVLWKWETDHLPNKPENVKISKWLPQQDVLGHKNIKAFVTQGGLQSMEEAIANGVPLVGLPFFGDQPMNVEKMVNLGIAQSLDYITMTKNDLKETIVKVAQEPKYKERVLELKTLLDDQPMKSLDKAVWWIEYVIRHKGARHLRSPAVDMCWYQYFAIDVLAVVLASALFVIYFVKTVLKFSVSTKQKKLKVN